MLIYQKTFSFIICLYYYKFTLNYFIHWNPVANTKCIQEY